MDLDVWADLVDLVLPADCAGCGATRARRGLCAACAAALASVTPRRVRPDPEPVGLPRCAALAAYAGALRDAILAYKERGRHGLAAPLGDRLADVVVAALTGPVPSAAARQAPPARQAWAAELAWPAWPAGPVPVLLVPIPATAAAARERHGDHMTRLARRCARRLRRLGCPAAVAYPLRARPRADSAGLSSGARQRAAAAAFGVAPRRLPAVRAACAGGARLVLVDDVVTTGATLTAAATRLRAEGLDAPVAAVLAATRRRQSEPNRHCRVP